MAPDRSPAYSPTPSGGSYSGTLTAPQTGTYVLALTNPCGCYTPAYLSLNGQLPQGWTAVPMGPTEFTSVAPGTAPTATFQLTPPSYTPSTTAVVHAAATMGDMTRQAGVTVTVS